MGIHSHVANLKAKIKYIDCKDSVRRQIEVCEGAQFNIENEIKFSKNIINVKKE